MYQSQQCSHKLGTAVRVTCRCLLAQGTLFLTLDTPARMLLVFEALLRVEIELPLDRCQSLDSSPLSCLQGRMHNCMEATATNCHPTMYSIISAHAKGSRMHMRVLRNLRLGVQPQNWSAHSGFRNCILQSRDCRTD